MQGVDIPDDEMDQSDKSFDDVVRRAQAKAAGKSTEQLELEEIGFAYDTEESEG